MSSFLLPNQFPPHFSLSIAKLIFQDSFFLTQVKRNLPAEFFASHGVGGMYLQQAVEWAYNFYDQYNQPLTLGTFEYWSQQYISLRPVEEQQAAHQGLTHLGRTLFSEVITDAEFVQTNVYGWIRQESMKSMLVEMKQEIDKGRVPDEARYMERLSSIQAVGLDTAQGSFDMLHDVGLSYGYFMDKSVRNVIPLGLQKLDKALSGGIGSKEMLVIEAPPNTGKTTVMSSFGANLLKRGKNIVYVTLEQEEKLIAQKVLACTTGIRPHEFQAAHQSIYQWLEWLKANGGRMMLKQFPTGQLTVEELQVFLRMVQDRWGEKIDVVILDYADLMRSSRAKDKRYEELAEIYTALRGLAVTQNFALITATQTNRQGAKKEKVTITDLSECFEKAAIADVIISLCQTETEHRSGAMRFFLAKNRIGEKYVEIPYKIDYVLAYLEEKEMKEGWGAYPMPQQLQGASNQILATMGMYGGVR